MKLGGIINRITNSEDKKEIFYKSFSSLVFRVLSYGLGFLFVFIIARFYSVDAQGIFSIAFTILSLTTLISKLGIQTSMVKWLSNYFYNQKTEEAKRLFFRIYKLTLAFSICLALIVFFLAEQISMLFFNKESLIFPIKIIAIAIPFFASTEIIANYFRSKKNIILFSFYSYASKFVLPVVILIVFGLFFSEKHDVTPIYAYSIGIIIMGLVAFIHAFLSLSKIKTSTEEQISYRKILKVSLPMLFSSSLVMLMWWSDTFILGVFKSEAEVGIYSIAVRLATIVSFVYNAVISILLPKIAQYYQNKEKEKLNHTVQYSAKLIFLATIPIALVLGLFPKFFLSIFGEVYKEGYFILILLLIAQFTNSIAGPVGPFLNMSGREKEQLYFICIALIVNLSVSIYLVKDYGGEGVAIGSALGMIIWNVVGAIYIKAKLGHQTWIKL